MNCAFNNVYTSLKNNDADKLTQSYRLEVILVTLS